PHRDKKKGFERCIAIVQEQNFPMEKVLLDHGNEETIKITRDLGCWSGFSIYPHTKMDPARRVSIVKEFGIERFIINSAADWGVSDPMMVPRTAAKLEQAGVPRAQVEQLVWKHPIQFFGQSGRLNEEMLANPASANLRETYEGNSVLRGQDPDKM
ncbi:MAG: hydrolase TatD, partial [Planctomycetota bacterium]|nr:hydrolase TatD [Planctomycetota bacterium]